MVVALGFSCSRNQMHLLKGCCHSAIPSIYSEIPHELGKKEQSSQKVPYVKKCMRGYAICRELIWDSFS
ncbi:MAG TPA: hypothetical protein VGK47_00885, partial [Nitrososphaeraceae archaeon]